MYLFKKKFHVVWQNFTSYIFFFLFQFCSMSSGIGINIEDSAFLKKYITLLVFYPVVERL